MEIKTTTKKATRFDRIWRRKTKIVKFERLVTRVRIGYFVILVALNTSCISSPPCPPTISLQINPQKSSIAKRPTSNNQPKVRATMTNGSFYCQKELNEVDGSKVDLVRIYITTNIDYTIENKRANLSYGSSFSGRVELFTRNGTSISEKEFSLDLGSLLEGQNKTTMSTSIDIMAETARDIDRISIGWMYR